MRSASVPSVPVGAPPAGSDADVLAADLPDQLCKPFCERRGVGDQYNPDHRSSPFIQRAILHCRTGFGKSGTIGTSGNPVHRASSAILRALASGPRRLGVSDLSDRLGLAKGTTHGLLRTLQAEGLVEQDPETGKYQLGAALLQLGNSYLDVNELRAPLDRLVRPARHPAAARPCASARCTATA